MGEVPGGPAIWRALVAVWCQTCRACVDTAITVVSGLVGGLLAKIGLRYALRWKAAARLAGKVSKLVGNIMDVAKNWGKTSTALARAKRGLAVAKTRLKNSVGRGGDSCFQSFVGETRVVMANGRRKTLSDIKPGDRILAANPKTGKRTGKRVTAVWVHQDTMVELKIAGGKAVTTTEDHPFWNQTDHEWQPAKQLDSGDKLRTAYGGQVAVKGIYKGSARTETAFNLTITDLHTYHVLVDDTPVLVHNCGGGINEKGKLCDCKDGDPIRDRATDPLEDTNKRWSGVKDTGKIIDQGLTIAEGVPVTEVSAPMPSQLSPGGPLAEGGLGGAGVVALVVVVMKIFGRMGRR